MNTAARRAVDGSSWRDLYQAALLETDVNKLPVRISEAENALGVRARELFYAADDDGEEGQSLDDALCVLHALHSSLKRRPTAVEGIHKSKPSRSA